MMAVDPTRVRRLNELPVQRGAYVLYWMQAAQRVLGNDALAFAAEQANELGRPLVVAFGLVGRYLGAGQRPYRFMLQGIEETARGLAERKIAFVIRQGSPDRVALDLGARACCVVADRGYLRHQVRWARYLARRLPCALFQVETNLVVPVEVASPKEEYAARTLRPRIHRQIERYLHLAPQPDLRRTAVGLDLESDDLPDPDGLMSTPGVAPSHHESNLVLRGGEQEARRLLGEFVERKLADYDALRNEPGADALSQMSPYLHMGQISPVEIALRVGATGLPSAQAYLEELIVRRELAINMVHYNPHYDALAGLPAWALKTLAEHAADARPLLYSLGDLEAARTHDAYWNAAQREMLLTGKMHGYMRMYWGKKILEWSPNPATALARILYLNDAYELDGRDPNGYAGALWCMGKHDQAWGERPIYGKVRYMNARGLERKFDIGAYVRRVAAL
jgi:deoxyribodipyrimidine photo-lyase